NIMISVNASSYALTHNSVVASTP
ncbi:hypothetical protein MGSAQ_001523, partial [marine sediment metagenome]